MIVTNLRNSSISTYDMCEHKFYISFNLGLQDKGNAKATKGNVAHKVLELLAQKKLCDQNNTTSFEDDLLGGMEITQCEDYLNLLDLAFNYYAETTDFDLNHSDYLECKSSVEKALSYNHGEFDPRRRRIISPEKRFDIEIKKPWAKYKYNLPSGEVLDGYLTLKGTIDLVTESYVSPNVIEIIDWKTGRSKDWATDQEKDYKYLKEKDLQLKLYHYAATQLYPDIEDIFITIFFINHGGPFTIDFSRSDLKDTEEIIREKFFEIKNTINPKLLVDTSNRWKCRFCEFSTKQYENGKTVCKFFKDEIIKNGIVKTTNEYADFESLNKYFGGGRQSG